MIWLDRDGAEVATGKLGELVEGLCPNEGWEDRIIIRKNEG